jgi:hypothetical protein
VGEGALLVIATEPAVLGEILAIVLNEQIALTLKLEQFIEARTSQYRWLVDGWAIVKICFIGFEGRGILFNVGG